jgi:hypothetical protein
MRTRGKLGAYEAATGLFAYPPSSVGDRGCQRSAHGSRTFLVTVRPRVRKGSRRRAACGGSWDALSTLRVAGAGLLPVCWSDQRVVITKD